jgi:hypothetical protein
MHMVGHEDIRVKVAGARLDGLLQDAQEDHSIRVVAEQDAAIVPAHDQVLGQSCNVDSRQPSHVRVTRQRQGGLQQEQKARRMAGLF